LNLATLMKVIAKEYTFHIYHIVPFENGYLAETNVGRKRISIWKEKRVVNFSFTWREKLAENGFRQVDRFIRTRDGSPYVKVEDEYVVVQDVFQGEKLSLATKKEWQHLGSILGALFHNCRHASETLLNQGSTVATGVDLGEKRIANLENLREYKKILYRQEDNTFTLLAKTHWRSIEQRARHAIILLKMHPQQLSLLPSSIDLGQFIWLEKDCLSYSTTSQFVVHSLWGMGELMKKLYEEKNPRIEELELFYQGFEQESGISLEEQYSLLAALIFPARFLSILTQFHEGKWNEQECVEAWMRECEKQDKLDQVQVWFARHLDRVREGRATL